MSETWPAETITIDRGGRRQRRYIRKITDHPGRRDREAKKALGLKWCHDCRIWLACDEVPGKNGLCRPHANEKYRAMYAKNPTPFRIRAARQKAIQKKKGAV